MFGIVYSRRHYDSTEVYHTDPSCPHLRRIIRNGNELTDEVNLHGIFKKGNNFLL